jgi:hypothetical protein
MLAESLRMPWMPSGNKIEGSPETDANAKRYRMKWYRLFFMIKLRAHVNTQHRIGKIEQP